LRCRQARLERAVADYDQALKIDPNPLALTYFNRARS
jgi:hypothetical protein